MGPTAVTTQAISQAPCCFFDPDAKHDVRQHGHLYPGIQQMMSPTVPTLPSTPIYSRPKSACSQRQAQQPLQNAQGAIMTPMAAPQPFPQKPTILVETKNRDDLHYLSTPFFSTSGTRSSPLNPMFSGLNGIGDIKDAFQPAVNFSVGFTNGASPPLSPVYLPQAQTSESTFTGFIDSASLLSSACPSPSPSPSYYARSVSSGQDVDFCNPRHLTVGLNPTLILDFSGLSDEKGKVDSLATASVASTFNKDSRNLEPESDFAGLINIKQVSAPEGGHPQACTDSSIVSFGPTPNKLPGYRSLDTGKIRTVLSEGV